MKIAVIKEIKSQEYRVGATPDCVRAYVNAGHRVKVQRQAGEGSGFSDDEYINAGAEIESDVKKIFDWADMIIKVKEPLPEEYELLREGQILFTYLHLAADGRLTKMLTEKKVSAVGYETMELDDGTLPCLVPMSEIAGRLSVQEGAKYLERPAGGKGLLLGGVPGVRRGRVTIIGGGTAGRNAAEIAIGIGADVTILDISHEKLRYLDDIFGSSIKTLYSNHKNLCECLKQSDLIIGAVLITGASAPKLISREDLKLISPRSVIVDIAVDQGGCVETTRPTTHDNPTFIVDDVVHYCVANMPGAVPITSTIALTDQTLRYGISIANKGLIQSAKENRALRKGINTYNGYVTHRAVAESLGLKDEYRDIETLLNEA